jgi:hypothetical protein
VNAPPQVTAIRHMTLLTLDSLRRVWTIFPFVIGILERLTIQRVAVRLELMASRTKLGSFKRRRPYCAAVGESIRWLQIL